MELEMEFRHDQINCISNIILNENKKLPSTLVHRNAIILLILFILKLY